MRIYLLSEGVPHAPTETVKSVHTTLVAAVGYAEEILDVGIGQWSHPEEMDAGIMGFQKIWVAGSSWGNMYITEWETKE
jgi:hypothetical protein